MSTYVLLLPGAEATWENATEAERRAGYDAHNRFAEELGKRGHSIVGGKELTPTAQARTVRAGDDGPVVTDGPFAELSEQVTGFYVVDSEDLDDLAEVCGLLVGTGAGAVEIRGTVVHEGY